MSAVAPLQAYVDRILLRYGLGRPTAEASAEASALRLCA